jgi:hypothetical protein
MKVAKFLGCFLLLSVIIYGQEKDSFLKFDLKSFEEILEKSPSIANRDLWEFLHKSSESAFSRENYNSAKVQAEKAKLVANKIGDLLLQYNSNYQLGKIEILSESEGSESRARTLFREAYNFYLQESNRIAPKKIEIEKERAYFYYYWSLLDSNPNYINESLDAALAKLRVAYIFHSVYPGKIYDDAFVLTSLQIARCFGITGNNLAKLIWIENAKTRFSENSEIKNQLLFQIYLESHEAYLRLGDTQSAFNQLNNIEALKNRLSPKSLFFYFRSGGDFNYQTQNKKLQDFFYSAGINLAKKESNLIQLGSFYISQMFSELNSKNVKKAETYLPLIEDLLKKDIKLNKIQIYAAKALIAGYKSDFKASNEYFTKAKDILAEWGGEWRNVLFLYSCEVDIARFHKDYEKLKIISQHYLDTATKFNNRTSFYMYINLSKANKNLGNIEES